MSIHGEGQGTKVKVFNDTVSELDITYMLNRNWRVELILGTIPSEKTWSALGDVTETKVLPPTRTLQYHFLPETSIRPYIELG